MHERSLDEEFPQGNPAAVTCRLCSGSKIPLKDALVCRKCDALPLA